MRSVLPVLLLVTSSLNLAGCGGGSAGSAQVADAAVTIVFPAADAVLVDASLTVRGTAASSDGVESLAVNGVAAASDDGFATWRAQITVPLGATALDVSVVTGSGARIGVTRAVLHPGPFVSTVREIVASAVSPELFVLDLSADRVLEVDLATGLRRTVVGEDVGDGPAVAELATLAVDVDGGRVFVATRVGTIVAVDRLTGMRSLLVAAGVANAPAFDLTRSLVFDPVGHRLLALVGVGAGSALLAIDPASGDVTTLSADVPNHPAVGVGPGLSVTGSMDLDPIGQRAFVVSVLGDRILEIDLVSGNRVDRLDTATPPPPRLFVGSTWDPIGSRLLLVVRDETTGAHSVQSVDVVSGLFMPLVEAGAGETLIGASDVAIVAGGDLVLTRVQEILIVDPVTGVRTPVADTRRGSGAHLVATADTARDPETGTLWLTDGLRVVAVDPESGDRTLVSSSTDATLGPRVEMSAMTYDGARARLLVAARDADTGNHGIFAIDPVTGARTFVTSRLALPQGTISPGAALRSRCLTYDAAADRLVAFQTIGVVETYRLGDGTFASSPAPTPAVASPRAAVMGPADTLFAIDGAQVVAVDLATGARTPLAPPPPDSSPQALALDPGAGRLVVLASALVEPPLYLGSLSGLRYETSLYSIDLTTGLTEVAVAVPVLAPFGEGRDVELDAATGLAWVASGANLFFLDASAVLTLDLKTGDLAVHSR